MDMGAAGERCKAVNQILANTLYKPLGLVQASSGFATEAAPYLGSLCSGSQVQMNAVIGRLYHSHSQDSIFSRQPLICVFSRRAEERDFAHISKFAAGVNVNSSRCAVEFPAAASGRMGWIAPPTPGNCLAISGGCQRSPQDHIALSVAFAMYSPEDLVVVPGSTSPELNATAIVSKDGTGYKNTGARPTPT